MSLLGDEVLAKISECRLVMMMTGKKGNAQGRAWRERICNFGGITDLPVKGMMAV